jgi:MOB kinase activator 1
MGQRVQRPVVELGDDGQPVVPDAGPRPPGDDAMQRTLRAFRATDWGNGGGGSGSSGDGEREHAAFGRVSTGTMRVDVTRTLRPQKHHRVNSTRFEVHQLVEHTLGEVGREDIDLRQAVKRPESIDRGDWLCVHTLDFYNDINLVFGAVSDLCTAESCPCMSAGSR